MRAKACGERMREADILLANLAEQRQMAQDAVTADVLLRKRQLHDNRQEQVPTHAKLDVLSMAVKITGVQLGMLFIWVHLCSVCSNKAHVLHASL